MTEDAARMIYRHDWAEVAPAVAVVRSVCDAADLAVDELPLLNDTIDTDALNRICTFSTNPHRPTVVSFIHAGHSVTVDGEGTVTVELSTEYAR
ncbi:hypothetical protein DVK02_11545 [Halobellus sp. Atlit-31R]|nr:hypothetical protein DVK02_11545 [Halobellus sp. Atlit-31R]